MVNNKILLFILILTTTHFWGLTIINEQICKFINYIVMFYYIAVAYNTKNYNNSIIYIDKFSIRTPIKLLLCSFVISIFMSYILWNQSLIDGIITTLPYFLYGFILVFKKNKLSSDTIGEVLFYCLCISILVRIVNYITYPNVIFGAADLNEVRGGIRMTAPGIQFIVLGFFFYINKYLITRERIILLYIGICLIFILLSLTRQVIFFSFVLGILMLLTQKNIKHKFSKIIISGCILFFILNSSIINNLIKATGEQIAKNEDTEDVRLRGYKFYMYELQPNIAAHILGCGRIADEKTEFSHHLNNLIIENRCFIGDVGYAGFYFQYGAIGLFLLLWIMKMSVQKNNDVRKKYCRYFIIYYAIISISSSPIGYKSEFILLTIILYLINIKIDNSKETIYTKSYSFKIN